MVVKLNQVTRGYTSHYLLSINPAILPIQYKIDMQTDMERFDLLNVENNPDFARYMPGLLIVTFYKVTNQEEASNTIKSLKTRIADILTANPWLMGRIKLDQDANKVYLAVDKNQTPDSYIQREFQESRLTPAY